MSKCDNMKESSITPSTCQNTKAKVQASQKRTKIKIIPGPKLEKKSGITDLVAAVAEKRAAKDLIANSEIEADQVCKTPKSLTQFCLEKI